MKLFGSKLFVTGVLMGIVVSFPKTAWAQGNLDSGDTPGC